MGAAGLSRHDDGWDWLMCRGIKDRGEEGRGREEKERERERCRDGRGRRRDGKRRMRE